MMKRVLLALIMSMTFGTAYGGNILIPGYEALHFKAGQTEQQIIFRNPQENQCYFRLSLYLDDGTEIWRASDILEPGGALTSIELHRPLTEGTYPNAVLKYECYSLGDNTRLNGAEIRLMIKAE